MKSIRHVVWYGAIAVVLFDAIAALASRSMGFAYTNASYGSFLIYAIAGFFGAKVASWKGAALVGLALGLVDATIGWAVSWVIGPGRPPDTTFSVWMWPVVAISVSITAIICALIGGVVARVLKSETREV